MNKIKELRKKYGKQYSLPGGKVTQEQLGKLMGYSKWQIQRLETGVRRITPHVEVLLETAEKALKSGDVKFLK